MWVLLACRVDHEIKGQGIYAYVTLAQGTKPSPELKKKLNEVVRNQIGSFAVPDVIHWAPGETLNAVQCAPGRSSWARVLQDGVDLSDCQCNSLDTACCEKLAHFVLLDSVIHIISQFGTVADACVACLHAKLAMLGPSSSTPSLLEMWC